MSPGHSLHASAQLFENSRRRRQTRKLAEFIRTVDETIVNDMLASLSKELLDLGIDSAKVIEMSKGNAELLSRRMATPTAVPALRPMNRAERVFDLQQRQQFAQRVFPDAFDGFNARPDPRWPLFGRAAPRNDGIREELPMQQPRPFPLRPIAAPAQAQQQPRPFGYQQQGLARVYAQAREQEHLIQRQQQQPVQPPVQATAVNEPPFTVDRDNVHIPPARLQQLQNQFNANAAGRPPFPRQGDEPAAPAPALWNTTPPPTRAVPPLMRTIIPPGAGIFANMPKQQQQGQQQQQARLTPPPIAAQNVVYTAPRAGGFVNVPQQHQHPRVRAQMHAQGMYVADAMGPEEIEQLFLDRL